MNFGLLRRKPALGRRQRGSAAVEFAIMMPILAIVLAPMILCARYMWHYTVAHKAAQDAARYMSAVSVTEIRSRPLATIAREVAIEIARREVSELLPGEDIPEADIDCDTVACGVRSGAVPATIKVFLAINMYDPIFDTYLGPWGTPIEVTVVVPYVGK